MKTLFIVTTFGLLISCSGELEQRSYVDWVRDYGNGLHIRKTQNDVIFDLQLQPTEYMALQRIGENINAQQLLEITNDLKDTQFFTLVLQHTITDTDFINAGINSVAEKQQKLYYYSYLFQEDIFLVEPDGSKYPCVLYHFEKTVDLQNSRTFVLGFENNSSNSQTSTLIIKSPWLGTQPIELNISKKDIPSLKI